MLAFKTDIGLKLTEWPHSARFDVDYARAPKRTYIDQV